MWHCVFGYVNVQCTCICNSAGESSTSLPVLLTEAYCKDSNADRNTCVLKDWERISQPITKR